MRVLLLLFFLVNMKNPFEIVTFVKNPLDFCKTSKKIPLSVGQLPPLSILAVTPCDVAVNCTRGTSTWTESYATDN